ncbi:histidinol-phosphate transaminase [Paenibacillus sp. GCM10012307]|uniref:Histidinol-phosphate aminotransferase n=1 Tax=Paenibacillus roseus TaxID=2798579 RepID=A0A934MMZ7_9BACL|nr:histidinol-phosphate transaminase [Paenibacillus roseus]MBJ6360461.1 histidinol-phosphate transaminase [Paenibacillus roseus]
MNYVLPHIDKLEPYKSGIMPKDHERAIRLHLNESPYPPSPEVLAALQHTSAEVLHRYPDPQCTELRQALADFYQVESSQVFCSNGSSELIGLLFRTLIGEHRRVAIPYPSFALYENVAASYQSETIRIPTDEDFSIDIDQLMACAADVIVLVNPNAPTGLLLPASEVERLARGFDGLVVIDEAYMEFVETDESVIPLIRELPNLLVIRTFSKAYALCGGRVGYALGNSSLISAFEKGRNSYHLNTITQRLALAALKDQQYMKSNAAAVRRTRDAFSSQLAELGFTVFPSQTNFVLCTPPANSQLTAFEWMERLMEQEIYVRYFNADRLRDKLRISIGTDEQMDHVIAQFKAALNYSD